ncbi:hypothetical protein HT118_07065 [Escherichia coli]|nr:hypothetical protein [Escherichia coli]
MKMIITRLHLLAAGTGSGIHLYADQAPQVSQPCFTSDDFSAYDDRERFVLQLVSWCCPALILRIRGMIENWRAAQQAGPPPPRQILREVVFAPFNGDVPPSPSHHYAVSEPAGELKTDLRRFEGFSTSACTP